MARGGYRPGAGRPKGSKTTKANQPKEGNAISGDITDEAAAGNLDPLAYMLKVMNTTTEPKERRDRMAIAAAPFVHPRAGGGKGKKQEREERAKAAGKGVFSPCKPPLMMVRGYRDGER